jgi:hypothetical protein
VKLVQISPDELIVRYDAANAVVPPKNTDLMSQLQANNLDWNSLPPPTGDMPPGTPPPAPFDAGPGQKPMRSSTSGAMPQAESEVRKVLGSGLDIVYKDWSEPQEVDFEGKKHWEVSVKAGVIKSGEARKGRIVHTVKVYFRNGKVTKVVDEGGGSGGGP